jgi:hypothetical protein
MADFEKTERVATTGLKKNEAFYALSPEEQITTRQPVYKGFVAMNDTFYDVAFWLEKDAGKISKGYFLSGSVTEQWKPPENKQESPPDTGSGENIPF